MSEQQEISIDLAAVREAIDLEEAFQRLEQNADFKKVIGDGFLKEECVRLVHLRGSSAMQQEPHQTNILRQMDSIPGLLGYFQQITYSAGEARKALEDYQNELEFAEVTEV